MCGIVGYTGKTACVPELLAGLESLAYRGYDSAGVAVYDGTEIQLAKAQGHLANLEALLKEHPIPGRCGIGHTRWATHGEPSYVNAHPHTDDAKQIALVHNGIIENYQKLKQMLIGKGCEFVSETDTEVVAQLVGSLYTGDCLAAVTAAMRLLEGSFALAILFRDEPYTIYCCSKDSPMVVGHGDAESFVASDIPALLPHTRDVYFMEDRQIALLRVDGIAFYNEFGQPIEKKSTHVDWDVEAAKKGNFEHYMMKEICEEPVAFRKTLEQYVSKKDGRLKADMFPWDAEEAAALKGLTIVSCGTAFHAALLGKKFVERLAGIPVQVEIASEFRYGDPMLHSGDSLMVISQSGETADTIAALRLAKSRNCRTIAVCNVIGSTIARDAETVLFTYAGPEIAVAATKSYLTQLAVLYLTALDLAEKRGTMSEQDVHKRIDELFALGLSEAELIACAAELGSDTAFFVCNTPQLCTGRGEVMEPYPLDLNGMTLVIVKPDEGVSTREAYAGVRPRVPEIPLAERLRRPVAEWQGSVTNDFERHILAARPAIRAAKERLLEAGAVYASMSGSGSAVFGLFAGHGKGERLKALSPFVFEL